MMAEGTDAKSRWYIQALVGANNTGTESKPLGNFVHNIGAMGGAEIGYQFNPYIGLGLQIQYARNNAVYEGTNYGFNSFTPSINLEWNLSNTFLGYKNGGRKNVISLIGGVNTAFTSDLATGYVPLDGTGNNYALGFRASLQYERALAKSWAFLANVGINMFNDKFDHVKGGDLDSYLGLQVGIRKYFSSSKRRKDFDKNIVNVIEHRDTVVIENIEEIRKPKDVYAIFFEIDKIIIRDSEVSKIQAVADFMKAHPEKVVFIFGYADKNTGTVRRNAWLAKNRARVIYEELVNTYGIDESRIISYHQGDKVQPYPEEEFEKNRATVCVITDLER